MNTQELFDIWNKMQYEKAIKEGNEDFTFSIREFSNWLIDNDMWDRFEKDLNCPFNDLYDIAWDYSIPIIMVKYFKHYL